MDKNKTQADVQPGGGVRLATVLYDRAHDLLGDAYNAGTHGIGYSQQAMELHDAIIPAQPSPGGQDATSQVVPRMVSTAPEKIFLQIGDGDYSDEPFPHPAGEEITWCSDSIVESEVAYVRADLAAPRAHSVELARAKVKIAALELQISTYGQTAQAVDLGQFRESVQFAHDMGSHNKRAERARLLALIDNQAVGK